jgi:hypothetical protein
MISEAAKGLELALTGGMTNRLECRGCGPSLDIDGKNGGIGKITDRVKDYA